MIDVLETPCPFCCARAGRPCETSSGRLLLRSTCADRKRAAAAHVTRFYHGTSLLAWAMIKHQGVLRPSNGTGLVGGPRNRQVWDIRGFYHPVAVYFTDELQDAAKFSVKRPDTMGWEMRISRGWRVAEAEQDGVVLAFDVPVDEEPRPELSPGVFQGTFSQPGDEWEWVYADAIPVERLSVVAYLRKGHHWYDELARFAPAPDYELKPASRRLTRTSLIQWWNPATQEAGLRPSTTG